MEYGTQGLESIHLQGFVVAPGQMCYSTMTYCVRCCLIKTDVSHYRTQERRQSTVVLTFHGISHVRLEIFRFHFATSYPSLRATSSQVRKLKQVCTACEEREAWGTRLGFITWWSLSHPEQLVPWPH